jgi:hypothetical protein
MQRICKVADIVGAANPRQSNEGAEQRLVSERAALCRLTLKALADATSRRVVARPGSADRPRARPRGRLRSPARIRSAPRPACHRKPNIIADPAHWRPTCRPAPTRKGWHDIWIIAGAQSSGRIPEPSQARCLARAISTRIGPRLSRAVRRRLLRHGRFGEMLQKRGFVGGESSEKISRRRQTQ